MVWHGMDPRKGRTDQTPCTIPPQRMIPILSYPSSQHPHLICFQSLTSKCMHVCLLFSLPLCSRSTLTHSSLSPSCDRSPLTCINRRPYQLLNRTLRKRTSIHISIHTHELNSKVGPPPRIDDKAWSTENPRSRKCYSLTAPHLLVHRS